jgi:DNA-binding GntR family transcriptional regulator
MVVRLTTEELRDSYAVRAVLEGLAARLATENRSDDLSANLNVILTRMKFAAEKGDSSTVNALDADFHRTIWEKSSNNVLYDALIKLYARIQVYIPITVREDGLLTNWKDHVEILNLLEAGDPIAAEKCMRHHVEAAAIRLLRRG